MEKSKFTEETTAQQKPESLKQALKTSFEEPSEVHRRRLASELGTLRYETRRVLERGG